MLKKPNNTQNAENALNNTEYTNMLKMLTKY